MDFYSDRRVKYLNGLDKVKNFIKFRVVFYDRRMSQWDFIKIFK